MTKSHWKYIDPSRQEGHIAPLLLHPPGPEGPRAEHAGDHLLLTVTVLQLAAALDRGQGGGGRPGPGTNTLENPNGLESQKRAE